MSNKAVSEFRRSDAFRRRQPDLYRRYQAREADTSDQALNGIALEQVAKIINGLSDKQKKIAMLRWNGNMTLSEIAAELGSAEGTIAAQLHNIRRKLRIGVGPTALKFPELGLLMSGFRLSVTDWRHVHRGGVTGSGGP